MGTDAERGRLGLELPSEAQQIAASAGVGPPVREIREKPSGAFQPVESFELQPRVLHFGAKILGAVKVSSGEVVEALGGIPMLALPQILLDNGSEARVREEIAAQAVQSRRVAGDGGCEDQASWLEDPSRFKERPSANGRARASLT
jgi:hypothetical protein